jgi:spermidine synthase
LRSPEASDSHAAESPAPALETAGGEQRLIVDGAVQSVAVQGDKTPKGYWPALVPRRVASSALILGFGGGTVAHLLRRESAAMTMTGVDNDPRVLDLARSAFGADAAGIRLILADAEEFVRECSDRYGLVIVDLFCGETLATSATRRAFLRGVRSLVCPGGTLVWNLHRDTRGAIARRRVGSGLLLDMRIFAGLNLVLHFHRRRYRRVAR